MLAGIEGGGLAHAYRLVRPLTGARARVVEVRHAPGSDRARDVLVLESGAERTRAECTLGDLRGELSRGVVVRDPLPMSFQIDFKPIRGDAFAVEKSLRELFKYMVKPGDLHAMEDGDLLAVMDAGGRRFRRARAYGLLHGGKAGEPSAAGVETLRPVGTWRYDP